MTAERWHRIEHLFHQAVEIPTAERHHFLRHATHGDESLRREVECLLAADGDAQGYMEWRTEADPLPEIRGYRLSRVLGEGGMGIVYLAEQIEPVRRQVALKLIRSGLMRRDTVLRFEAERQALARMQHPNIAQVFEAGTTGQGQPFLTIEYVPGPAITRYCDRNRLGVRQRLELFIQVCEAVQHLHRKGVLHRDVKPSNVLVMEEQARPVPKIIDFGIAKALEQPLVDETLRTGRELLGTPTYMSPEAIGAPREGLDVDTRCDVYSLGVLLYELLVGSVPFGHETEDLRAIFREITSDEEAERPSSRFGQMDDDARAATASRRSCEPSSLRRALEGDLDWITLKALAKERSRRYGSAAELSADIVRHLRHEPVVACPPALLYRTKKYVRRHLIGVAAALLVTLALLAGIIGRSLEAERANREAQRANREARKAQQVSDFLVELFSLSDPSNGRATDTTVLELVNIASERITTNFENEPMRKAILMNTLGTVYKNLGTYDRAFQMLSGALEIRQSLLPANDPDVAASLHNLATLKVRQGQYREAEPLFRQALTSLESALGRNHPKRLQTLNNLAVLYDKQGRFAEAADLYIECLRIQERSSPGSGRATHTMMNLAITYAKQGDVGEAERLLVRALETERGRPQPNRDRLERIYHNLAGVYDIQENYEKAATYYRKSLAIDEEIYGPGHLESAATLSNLALVSQAQGHYAEAERLHLRSLEIKKRFLRPDHPDVAQGLHRLAALYEQQGRYTEAERHFLESRELARRSFEPDHPFMGESLAGLARLYLKQGRRSEADPLFKRALEIFEANSLSLHPDMVRIEDDYARLLREADRAAEPPSLEER